MLSSLNSNNTQTDLYIWIGKSDAQAHTLKNQIFPALSDSEKKRLDATKSNKKQLEFLLCRSLLRHCLRNLSTSQQEWLITERPGNSPQISPHQPDLHYSISHSHGLVCIAFSSSPIGIDIEKINTKRNHLETAREFMTAKELLSLSQQNTISVPFFYKIWTLKESIYKILSSDKQRQFNFGTTSAEEFLLKQGFTAYSAQYENHFLTITSPEKSPNIIIQEALFEESGTISERQSPTSLIPVKIDEPRN